MAVPENILKVVNIFDPNYDIYKSISYNEEGIKINFANPPFQAPAYLAYRLYGLAEDMVRNLANICGGYHINARSDS